MNLNQVTLPATDVARSAGFYRRLGFVQIVESLPDYARFECPNGEATFSLHRTMEVAPHSGVVVYFECRDLDSKVAGLKRAGIQFEHDPQDQPWLWREAYLRDPDGNLLCLFHAGENRRHPPWRLRAGSEPQKLTTFSLTVEDHPHPADTRVLQEGLALHSVPFTPGPGFKPLAVFLRDQTSTVVGGAAGTVNWNWLFISLLWLRESLRGTGHGKRVLAAIEAAGMERGCTRAHLDTFSYQARPFYERHGYRVFGTLENYPPGHRRFFLEKVL